MPQKSNRKTILSIVSSHPFSLFVCVLPAKRLFFHYVGWLEECVPNFNTKIEAPMITTVGPREARAIKLDQSQRLHLTDSLSLQFKLNLHHDAFNFRTSAP